MTVYGLIQMLVAYDANTPIHVRMCNTDNTFDVLFVETEFRYGDGDVEIVIS